MMYTTNSIKCFILSIFIWSTLLAGVNYIIDPIQFYRKDKNPIFVKNQRYQIPGLINNYDFDTIFIGTSHTENHKASYFDKLYNSKSINLAISGSSAWEQSKVVNKALEKKTLNRILWEANYKSFSVTNQNSLSNGKFPTYLYSYGFKTHFYYLFSIDTLWMSVKNIIENGYKDLDTLNSWAKQHADKFNGTNIIKHYCSTIKKTNQLKKIPDFESSIETYLITVINKNPEVQFDLFIPPMSYLNYIQGNASQRFNRFRKALYEKTEGYDNVIIHDFNNDLDLISEHKNYKDIEHFSEEISNMMLKTIAGYHQQPRNPDIDLVMDQFNDFIKQQSKAVNFCSTPSQP